MKKSVVLLIISIILTSSVFAGVVKKTKTEVSFKDFGKFTSDQIEKLTIEKKLIDSNNKFKGKGIMGKLSGKFFLKSGESGELIDLPAMIITKMDHKKKEFRQVTIEKITSDEDAMEAGFAGEAEEEEEQGSEIKVIRSEFRVEDTGESKNINNFPSKKYGKPQHVDEYDQGVENSRKE